MATGSIPADNFLIYDPTPASTYSTLKKFVQAINGYSTGDVILANVPGDIGLFESSSSYAITVIVYKASSSNAYYLAFNRGNAVIGNISLEGNGSVTSQHDLAYTSSVTSLGTTVSGHTTSISNLSSTVSGHTTSIGNLNTTTTGISTKLNSIEMRSVTHTYSCQADSAYTTNLKTIIDADLPSGYTCLGVVGWSSGNNFAVLYAGRYYNNNYSFGVRNYSNSDISDVTATIHYLCMKS